ncbi:aromatic ring-opening dioxygenase LigA [Mycetocola tolaasinivorans]|uniref:Aromatic ring-opening dioxygenase LigA n=1 Tax=Mycetocola tolaasinivorans TaxID=76635 RepID=A0A3L7A9H1_9MICO|nr:aromatic ring-opening dioxygenase LigA [Mycetocola tolaasinivorans]RLP76490.1 aromatic ring-opening dioxygenase LigA [Mycetocola tolaasinivorans]
MSESTAPVTLSITPGKATALRWAGIIALLAGVLMIVAGGTVWGVVTTQLKAENITVSEDAAFLGGADVAGPFSALAQADIISTHAKAMSDGKTYAELEKDDPRRATVMNASFLRTSLFTSVVSYGVSAFAIGAGILFGIVGWVVLTIAPRRRPAVAAVQAPRAE